ELVVEGADQLVGGRGDQTRFLVEQFGVAIHDGLPFCSALGVQLTERRGVGPVTLRSARCTYCKQPDAVRVELSFRNWLTLRDLQSGNCEPIPAYSRLFEVARRKE